MLNTTAQLKSFSRIAGLCYLVVIGLGLFAEAFVREKLVSADIMVTMDNIRSHEFQYRLGFVADIVNFIAGVPVFLFLYRLFSPSHKWTIALAIFFIVISNAVFAANMVQQLYPLLVMDLKADPSILLPGQRAALSSLALQVHSQGYAIGLVFFGVYCILVGGLICKTSFFPRVLGILYAIAGVCYLINSFVMFLTPGFRNPLFPYILMPSFIGELSLCLWLIFAGVRVEKEPAV